MYSTSGAAMAVVLKVGEASAAPAVILEEILPCAKYRERPISMLDCRLSYYVAVRNMIARCFVRMAARIEAKCSRRDCDEKNK